MEEGKGTFGGSRHHVKYKPELPEESMSEEKSLKSSKCLKPQRRKLFRGKGPPTRWEETRTKKKGYGKGEVELYIRGNVSHTGGAADTVQAARANNSQ